MTDENKEPHPMARRFRGFLPVVVDVETGGFNPETDALLEVAAVLLTMDEDGWLRRTETHVQQIDPFEGAKAVRTRLYRNRSLEPGAGSRAGAGRPE